MSHGHIFRALKEYGLRGTAERLFTMRTIKFGQLVGTDEFGNKYYENNVDYPHPQNRWVIYAGKKSFYENDASNVPAAWSLWLHNTTAEPPTATTVGSTHRVEPLQNSHGSSAPYARNLGGVLAKHTPNNTQTRPRGYGLGNGLWSAPGEEAYYTQPGYPTDPRNRSSHVSARRGRLGFSLRDTPLTIQAKAASRAGLSLEEYQAVADEAHPTRALLLLTGGQVTKADAADLVAAARQGGDAALIEEALAGIPEDLTKRDQALRLAVNVPLSKEDEGSLAAAVASALTKEEQQLLEEGQEIEALRDRAGVHQAIIDEYKAVDTKEARRAVDKAVAIRDECLAKIAKLDAIEAKLAAIEAQFDGKAYDMAKKAVEAQLQ